MTAILHAQGLNKRFGAVIAASAIDDVELDIRGTGQNVIRADDLFQSLDQGCAGVRHGARY